MVSFIWTLTSARIWGQWFDASKIIDKLLDEIFELVLLCAVLGNDLVCVLEQDMGR